MNRILSRTEEASRISMVTAAHDLNTFMPISGERIAGNCRNAERDEVPTAASHHVEQRKSAQGLPYPRPDYRSK
jgi:hypothetical protein